MRNSFLYSGTLVIIGAILVFSATSTPWLNANASMAEVKPATGSGNAGNATSRLPSIPPSASLKDSDLELQLVFRGLQFPTAMEFVGADDILVLEKNNGMVKRIVKGVMLEEPLLDVEVATLVERGMLGIAIAKQNHGQESATDITHVFLYYTEAKKDGESAGAILERDEPINKFYAYGIRNSFGMDFDPITGKLWDTENGPSNGDEINLVQPGFNSGWADVTGMSTKSARQFDPEKELVSCLYCRPSTGILDRWFNQFFFGIQEGKYSEPEFTWSVCGAYCHQIPDFRQTRIPVGK